MANQKQLKILKQGVEVWNKWREEDSEVRANLHGANLEWANLQQARLAEKIAEKKRGQIFG